MPIFLLPSNMINSERIQQLLIFFESDIQDLVESPKDFYKIISLDEPNNDIYIDDVSQMLGFRTLKTRYSEKNKVNYIKNLYQYIKYLGSPKVIRNILKTYFFNVELYYLWTNDYKTYKEILIQDSYIYGYNSYRYLSSFLKFKFILRYGLNTETFSTVPYIDDLTGYWSIDNRIGTNQNLYSETWVLENPGSRWTNYSGAGEILRVADPTATDGYVLQIGNNSGDDQVYYISNSSIAINENSIYRIRIRAKMVSGTGTAFLGVAGRDFNDTEWVNIYGANSEFSQHYFAYDGSVLDSNWKIYDGYFKGKSLIIAGGYKPNIFDPGKLYEHVFYVRPLFLVNYANQPGQVEIDYVYIDEIENITDDSGYNNYGILSGNSQIITDNTLAFYGDSFQIIDDTGNFKVNIIPDLGNGNFTISFYIKAESENIVGNEILFSKEYDSFYYFILSVNATKDKIVFSYNYGGTTNTGEFDVFPFDNTWKHITLVRDNDDIKLYVDGIIISTLDFTGIPTDISNPGIITFGGRNDNTLGVIGGYFDELRIYLRAITEEEILKLALYDVELMDNEMYFLLQDDLSRYKMVNQVFQYESKMNIEYDLGTGGWLNLWDDVYIWTDASQFIFTNLSDDGLKSDDGHVSDTVLATILESFNIVNFGAKRVGENIHDVITVLFSVTANVELDEENKKLNFIIEIENQTFDYVTEFSIKNSLNDQLLYCQFPEIEKTGNKIFFYITINYEGII